MLTGALTPERPAVSQTPRKWHSGRPRDTMLIGDILRRQASATGRPNHPTFIHEGGATTLANLHAATTRVARTLTNLGTKAGDRVTFLGRTTLVWWALPDTGERRRIGTNRGDTVTGSAVRGHVCG